MKCPQCETELPADAQFCNKCGGKIELTCPACRKANPPDSNFCLKCGHNLALTPQAPPQPAPRDLSLDDKLATIKKYLPTGLAEKVLSQRDKIEGERKQVTVMFCDMADFTPLVEKLGPEEAYTMMDKVYEILIHKVHDYEGTVNELTGDGIMALFGAPIAVEDAPQRAIRSALAIHREITRFTDTITHESGTPRMKMRIGINTGPVVVGTLGNDLRVDFKAVGDTVNMAARMEQMAEPGTTYATEETFKLTEGFFRFEALGEKPVKGKEEPMRVYRVIALSSVRTRFEVSAERGLTPLIARGRERDLLLEGFEEVKAGHGRAFSIAAEAGVGKSRLLYEFRKAVAHEDATFLEGKCLSYGRGTAYQPLIDIVKANFYVQETDGDWQIRQKVRKGLEALGMDEASSMPFFLELLSVRDSGIDKLPISPEGRKERMIEVLKTIVLRGAERRTLILAFEDLHWIDESSEEVLKHILVSIPAARVMLIFTYRLEFLPSWGAKSYHMQVNLNRFSHRESHTMVSHLLATERFTPDLEELILGQSEGIPLFIEEFVKALKDLGMIELQENTYHLTKNINEIKIPSTIQEIIMSRVDSLPNGAKKVLQTGAVIEREFSYELIRRVSGLLERELLSQLSVLKDAELLYERGVFPQSSYIFKHALARDAVYDSIIFARKRRLHEQIAFAIEELYEKSIEEHYGVLAAHYEDAESYENAAEYARLAAQKAEKTASLSDAIAYAGKSVTSLEKLPQTEDVQKKRIDARTALSLYFVQMFYYLEAKKAVDPIMELAFELNDKKRLAPLLTTIANYEIYVEEQISKGVEHFEEAVKMSSEVGDIASWLIASWRLGLTLCCNCEFDRASGHLERVLDASTMQQNLWSTARLKSYLCFFFYFFQGRTNEAYQASKDTVRIAEESGDTYSKAIAYTTLGTCLLGKGLFQDATKHLLNGVRFCEEANLPMWNALAQWMLGETCSAMQEYETAESHWNSGVQLLVRGNAFPSWVGMCRSGAAMARVMRGVKDVDLESVYGFLYESGLKSFESWTLRLIAQTILNIDDQHFSEAEDYIKKGIQASKQNHMMWNLARSHALYAELFKRKGDLPKAKEHLTKAIGIFKDCGADGWVTKYGEELAKLS